MRKPSFFAYAALAAAAILPVAAFAESCETRLALAPASDGHFYASRYGIASSQDGACSLKALKLSPKSWIFMDEHGRRTFQGPDIQGYWNVADWTLLFGPASITTIGSTKSLELPKFEEERRTWLAQIDKEGWVTDYPFSGDRYQQLYPARFTHIGDKAKVDHSQFEIALQTYQYVTMENKARAALAAQLKFGCMAMEFVTWSEPEQLEKQESSLRAFLASISLEDVNAAPDLVSKACTPRGARPIRMGQSFSSHASS